MSVRAMSWVWQQPIKGTAKLVLLALADHANDDGKCWPGIETVAKKCGVSRITVINNISKLKNSGFVNSERRYTEEGKRTSNVYTLCLSTDNLHTHSLCKESLRKDNVGLSKGGLPKSLDKRQLKEGDKSPPDNPKNLIWLEGLKLQDVTRSFLGKLCKEYSEDALVKAILETKERCPADPKSYIIGVLKNKNSDPFAGAI